MKSFRIPLALVLVLFVLGGLAYWDEKKTATDKKATDAKGKLYDFKSEDIVKIQVRNKGSRPEDWSLEKAEGKWRVITPLLYPADGEGMDRLLKILIDARFEREFEVGDKGLASYGLDSPQLTYRLTDKSGKNWQFSIGGKSPTGFSSYLKTDDDKHIYLANQYLFTATNKVLGNFRDRSLFIPVEKEVQSAQISWPGEAKYSVELKRIDKNWALTSAGGAKADTIEINKYLNAWERVRVIDFIDSPNPTLREALTNLGKGTKEYVKASFTKASGKRDISVVENNGKLYIKLPDGDTFGEIDKRQVDSLRKTSSDLLDKSIFTFTSPDVTDVTIDSAAYHREKSGWINFASKKPSEFVQGILVSLEFAKADSKLTKAQGEDLIKGPAIHTVVLKKSDKVVSEFSVWAKSGDGSLLLLKSDGLYYLVNSEFLDIIQPKQDAKSPVAGGEIKGEKS